MNKKMRKKRCVTLIEMMIVMFLIALITGVIAYNYRGTLEEGKAFKTKAGMERLENILNIAAANDTGFLDDVESQWQEKVRKSPFVQNANALLKDGWGKEYTVTVEDGEIVVRSDRYSNYLKSHPSMFADAE